MKTILSIETIKKDIQKIIKDRAKIYKSAPTNPNIKVNIVKEKCQNELCPVMHEMVKITADALLGLEILNISKYCEENDQPLLYWNSSFNVLFKPIVNPKELIEIHEQNADGSFPCPKCDEEVVPLDSSKEYEYIDSEAYGCGFSGTIISVLIKHKCGQILRIYPEE